MKRIYWEAFCFKERHAAINEIKEIVNLYGFIIESKMFSDVAMSFVVEIEEFKVDELYKNLKLHMKLKEFNFLDSNSKSEAIVLLNVTFTQGTGDFRIEVPPIPG
jgi:hypothetical protein